MIVDKMTIETKDNLELDALLYKKELNGYSNESSKEVVIFIHGCTSSMLHKRNDIFASEVMKNGMDFFCINTRGNEIITKIKNKLTNDSIRAGSGYENVLESDYDIDVAINAMIQRGYSKIHLLGHSLGCTKILYYLKKINEKEERRTEKETRKATKDDKAENTINNDRYTNKDIVDKYISKVGLLSLVDFRYVTKENEISKEKIDFVNQKVKSGFGQELDQEGFLCPATYNNLSIYYNKIDEYNFINYYDDKEDFNILSSLNKDVFIRYGTDNEMVPGSPYELADRITKKLNEHKAKLTSSNIYDIGCIEGARHTFKDKEIEVINQYIDFINKK